MSTNYLQKQNVSDTIYIEKAFAMCSVVIAHLSFSAPLTRIMGVVGTLGVPTFLILAGFLTKEEDADFRRLLPKLVKRIIIPWAILSTVTYGIHIVMDNKPFTYADCIAWNLGYMTWLYYVPVYLICRLAGVAYYKLHKRQIRFLFIFSIFALSTISKYLTQYGIWGVTKWMTPYQNPLNYIGYYFIGILIKRKYLWKVPEIKYVVFSLISSITGFLFLARMFLPTNSFLLAPVKLVMQAFVAIEFFYLSVFIAYKKTKIGNGLIYIGRKTYLLLFLHMQLGVSVYNAILNGLTVSERAANALTLFAPGIIITLIASAIFVTEKMLKRTILRNYIWVIGLE